MSGWLEYRYSASTDYLLTQLDAEYVSLTSNDKVTFKSVTSSVDCRYDLRGLGISNDAACFKERQFVKT